MTFTSRKLFLIDSIGALVSAVFYIALLANYVTILGVTLNAIYSLASMAGMYAIYSFVCYRLKLINWKPYLKIIALANIFHCVIILVLMFFLYQKLTILGLVYFGGEIIIVTSLVIIEWDYASREKKGKLKCTIET